MASTLVSMFCESFKVLELPDSLFSRFGLAELGISLLYSSTLLVVVSLRALFAAGLTA